MSSVDYFSCSSLLVMSSRDGRGQLLGERGVLQHQRALFQFIERERVEVHRPDDAEGIVDQHRLRRNHRRLVFPEAHAAFDQALVFMLLVKE